MSKHVAKELARRIDLIIEERDRLRDLCGQIIACLRANRLRGTLTAVDDWQGEFDRAINEWSDRMRNVPTSTKPPIKA